ncbi:MAG: hypothetical protein P4L33_08700 [Capsulimonadaceae bacterium]|nr:hypothetical protein [Capsulimonadaceae bacterium]
MHENEFTSCGSCAQRWATRVDFLADPSLRVVDYRANVQKLESGLVTFVHRTETCGATMAIPIGRFFDLYTGPRYTKNMSLTDACPRYCFNKTEFRSCKNQCSCAVARETTAIVMCCLDTARRRAIVTGEAAMGER